MDDELVILGSGGGRHHIRTQHRATGGILYKFNGIQIYFSIARLLEHQKSHKKNWDHGYSDYPGQRQVSPYKDNSPIICS